MQKTKKLGEQNITRLLFNQSYPATAGMFVFALYLIIDIIFIERVAGSMAIAGVFVCFPIYMMITAFSNMVGVGSSSIISRELGAGNVNKVKEVFGNFLILIITSGIFITLFGLLFLDKILYLFGATDLIFGFAYSYMSVIMMGVFFMVFTSASGFLIRSEGDAKFAMIITISNTGLNIVLDYIFVLLLKMGVVGAAIATNISLFVGFLMCLFYFVFKKTNLNISDAVFNLRRNILKNIFKIGSSTFVRQVSMSIRSAILNNLLVIYGGELAIASFGIIGNIFMFMIMPIFGIVQGLQPIVGYNFGSKKIKRVKETIKKAIISATFFSVISWIVVILFPVALVSVFTKDIKLIAMTSSALLIIAIANPLIGFQVIAGGLYQALGSAKKAMFLSLLRQVFLLIPLILILPKFFGLNGLWYAFPISDLLGAVIIFFILKREFKILDIIEKKSNI